VADNECRKHELRDATIALMIILCDIVGGIFQVKVLDHGGITSAA
jgi:hypothetical protein